MRNELVHYGIPDMHWYVRRYQNKDGTLTEEGKIRYGKADKDEMLKDLTRLENTGRKTTATLVATGAAVVAGLVGSLFLQKKIHDAKAFAKLGSMTLPHINNIEFTLK